MKLELWCIGKTAETYLDEGIGIYRKRINKYVPFEMRIIPDVKVNGKPDAAHLMLQEATLVQKLLSKDDYLITLDERGKTFSSVMFSEQLNRLVQLPYKRIIFLVGGAWGIHDTLKQKAGMMLSLSQMTFSHQMIRLFFTEQLYRAFSILNNEPYHNE